MLKPNVVNRSITLSFIISIMFYGCLSITSQQQLLENTTVPKIGVCSDDKANLNYALVDETNRFDPNNISVLSWNIHKNKAEDWADDFKFFVSNQDIIIIQEAHLDFQLQQILGQQEMNWTLNAAFYLDERPSGVLTASSIKPYYSCGYRINEPVIRIPKSTLIHYYRINESNASLLVANIHGINFTLGIQSYQKQIDKLIEIARRHSGPMIIAGDFNSWNDKRNAIVDEMVKALSLKTVEIEHSHQIRIFGNIVDHLFYRGLDPLSQESQVVTTSDHNPIRIQFRLAPA